MRDDLADPESGYESEYRMRCRDDILSNGAGLSMHFRFNV
jgi:hypothetical protein